MQPTPSTPRYTAANVIFGILASLLARLFLSFALLLGGLFLLAIGTTVYDAVTRGPARRESAALPGIIPPRPPFYTPVTDSAGLLTRAEADSLGARLRRFERASTTQMVVVTVPALNNEPIEDVAQRLYVGWGIGRKGQNNGVLLLAARQEHKIRIHVGYGLEGAIPDAVAGRLIREVMQPAFKADLYYKGFDAATAQLISLAQGEAASFEAPDTSSHSTLSWAGTGYWLLGIWLVLLLLQCRRHGGLVGLWAWTQSDWFRSAGTASGSGSSSDSGSSWSSSDSGWSSSDSSSDSGSSDSGSDWGGGESGGGGASGDW